MWCLHSGLASKVVQHVGLFQLPKITGIRFQNWNVSQCRFASTSEKSQLETRYFWILPNKWHLSKQLQRNAMTSQMDRGQSKQGQHWLANLSFFTVETNTGKENRRLTGCRDNVHLLRNKQMPYCIMFINRSSHLIYFIWGNQKW